MRSKSAIGKGLFFTFILCVMAQAAWIPFRSAGMEQKTTIAVTAADANGLLMDINLYGADLSEYDATRLTDTGHETFAILKIDEYAYLAEIGKPKLPMVTAVMDVPYQARIDVQIIGSEYTDYRLDELGINNRIAPALPSVPKIPGQKAQFVIDEKTYNDNAFFPNRLTGLFEGGGLARGHRLATVQFYPVQYNPVTGQVRVYTRIMARINFVGGDVPATVREISRDFSTVWEQYIERMVVNYPEYLRGVPPLPIYYDIFYNGQALTLANKIGTWKTKKGYKVRKWNAAGWTATQISDTIRLQGTRATFLTIIGDPNSSTIALPAGSGTSSGDQTDLYYAEVNESGYLPDMYYGRICVLDTIQGNISVNKALRYEHANFGSAGTAWLKRACLIAGYDGSYQPVGMATNWYCRNVMIPFGYTVDTLVIASSEQETRIVQKINAGTAWCVYTAHGSQTYWAISSSGSFTIPELNTTTNNDMYPMVAGHCCLAGDYQYSSDCFGETWDRIAGKGGLTYYGSVPSTYWDEDDWLQRRYFDAVYTDSISGRLYERGRYTQWGMYWIENHTSSSMKQYYFEAYHVFNDPSLDTWTDIPHTLAVTHLPTVFPGASTFTVNVKEGATPQQNALVCCWIKMQSPQMHIVAYTDASGNANLSVNPLNVGDTMYVTVTKHDFTPYEGYAIVTTASGPYVVVGTTSFNDYGNGQVNPGDSILYSVYGKNLGNATAQGVWGRLSEADAYVTITRDSAWYGNIPQSDSALSNPPYKFRVANNCPNGYTLPFTLQFHDYRDSIWTSHPGVMVYAPFLTYQSVAVTGGNGNGILDPGETANLVVTIRNEGGADAQNVTSTLMESSAYLTISDASGNYGTVTVGATANNSADPYTVTAAAGTPIGTVVPLQIQVVSGVYCDTLDFSLSIGRNMPTDTGYYYTYWSHGPYQQAPVYSWYAIDTTQTAHVGTSLGHSDDQTTTVTIPFTFRYYGVAYTQASICSNGWLALGSETVTSYINYGLPSTSAPAKAVFGVWDDLNPGATGPGDDYYYYDATNHRFVVEWFRTEHYGGGSTTQENFEILLYDPAYYPTPTNDGEIIIQYRNAMRETDNTVGIQNSGRTVGIQYYFDGAYHALGVPITDTFALKFTPIAPTVGVVEETNLSQLLATRRLVVYPTVSRSRVNIAYSMGSAAQFGGLKIYDISGRLVKSFVLSADPLVQTVIWNGDDESGRAVSAGVYFVKLTAGETEVVEKAVLLR